MTLYTADVMELAKKVMPPKTAGAIRKPRGPSIAAEKKKVEQNLKQLNETLGELEQAKEVKKTKKAAAKKAAAAVVEEVGAEEEEEEEVSPPPAKKPRKQKAKVVDAVEQAIQDVMGEDVEVAAPKPPRVRKPKKIAVAAAEVASGDDEAAPPAWMEKLIREVRTLQQSVSGEKKGQKKMRQEAKDEAAIVWKDDAIKEKVSHIRDQAFDKMYTQIFG